jgi:hypothetical protein
MFGKSERLAAANEKMSRPVASDPRKIASVPDELFVRHQGSFRCRQLHFVQLMHLRDKLKMRWKKFMCKALPKDTGNEFTATVVAGFSLRRVACAAL